jgi:hypothetical protein
MIWSLAAVCCAFNGVMALIMAAIDADAAAASSTFFMATPVVPFIAINQTKTHQIIKARSHYFNVPGVTFLRWAYTSAGGP